MAGTQAQRPSHQHEGTSATRLRTNRTNAQHSQTTVITTTQSGPNPQSHQYANQIGCSSSSGNGSTIAISTITTASNPSRVSKKKFAFAIFQNRVCNSTHTYTREKKSEFR